MSVTSNPDTNLVWIDLEMTGLDPEKCKIIEIGCLVTSKDLEIVAEGSDIIIHRDDEELSVMDDVVTKMHNTSGLMLEIQKSKISDGEAEEQTLNFVKQYSNQKMSPLCGNSVHIDRKFISKYMKTLDEYLSYRNIDVSTVKELYKRWSADPIEYKKKETHRALDDIRESVAELRYYRESGFISGHR